MYKNHKQAFLFCLEKFPFPAAWDIYKESLSSKEWKG